MDNLAAPCVIVSFIQSEAAAISMPKIVDGTDECKMAGKMLQTQWVTDLYAE